MTSSLPTASLNLKSKLIPNANDINTSRSTMTFRNINMLNVVGKQMYDKYDAFNISLKWMGYDNASGALNFGTSSCYICMSGLPYRHSTYDVIANLDTNNAIFGALVFSGSTTGGTVVNFATTPMKTFSKMEGSVDLVVTFPTLYDNAPNNGGSVLYPYVHLAFEITPVIY